MEAGGINRPDSIVGMLDWAARKPSTETMSDVGSLADSISFTIGSTDSLPRAQAKRTGTAREAFGRVKAGSVRIVKYVVKSILRAVRLSDDRHADSEIRSHGGPSVPAQGGGTAASSPALASRSPAQGISAEKNASRPVPTEAPALQGEPLPAHLEIEGKVAAGAARLAEIEEKVAAGEARLARIEDKVASGREQLAEVARELASLMEQLAAARAQSNVPATARDKGEASVPVTGMRPGAVPPPPPPPPPDLLTSKKFLMPAQGRRESEGTESVIRPRKPVESARRGPGVDLIDELRKAMRKRGLSDEEEQTQGVV